VVGNVRHHGLATEPEPEIYRPAYQAYWPFFGIAIRLRADAPSLPDALRGTVASLDRDLPVTDLRWLDERAADAMAWRRSSLALLGVFAASALLLATFGVYSVISYSVVQSRREIGLRMALGAEPRTVARAFLASGAGLAGLGLALGFGVSTALTRTIETLLFGIVPLDAVTYAAVAGLTGVVTLAAAVLPARAAARVDPVLALRTD
jgi:putative ABC transport system permease protein